MAKLDLSLTMDVLIGAVPERAWSTLIGAVGEWFENPDPTNPLHLRRKPSRVGGTY